MSGNVGGYHRYSTDIASITVLRAFVGAHGPEQVEVGHEGVDVVSMSKKVNPVKDADFVSVSEEVFLLRAVSKDQHVKIETGKLQLFCRPDRIAHVLWATSHQPDQKRKWFPRLDRKPQLPDQFFFRDRTRQERGHGIGNDFKERFGKSPCDVKITNPGAVDRNHIGLFGQHAIDGKMPRLFPPVDTPLAANDFRHTARDGRATAVGVGGKNPCMYNVGSKLTDHVF